jgi:outer membrane lipoprotein-sorting protein
VRRSYLILLLVTISGIIFLEGCAPAKQIQEVRMISADRLIKRLEATRRMIKTFNAKGTIAVKNSDMDTRSSFQVEIKRPDSVKISLFGPFGIDLASVLLTPNNFLFYDAMNDKCYKGKVKPGIMRELIKVDISYDQLIDIMTGSVNLTDKLNKEPDKYEFHDGNYTMTFTDSLASRKDIYVVNTEDFEILEYKQTDLKNRDLLDAQYSNFKKNDDMTIIPTSIKFNDSRNNQAIKIDYRSINVNKESDNLKLSIPDDAQIIQW